MSNNKHQTLVTPPQPSETPAETRYGSVGHGGKRDKGRPLGEPTITPGIRMKKSLWKGFVKAYPKQAAVRQLQM